MYSIAFERVCIILNWFVILAFISVSSLLYSISLERVSIILNLFVILAIPNL